MCLASLQNAQGMQSTTGPIGTSGLIIFANLQNHQGLFILGFKANQKEFPRLPFRSERNLLIEAFVLVSAMLGFLYSIHFYVPSSKCWCVSDSSSELFRMAVTMPL